METRQRGLVIAFFLVPQVGLRVPYVWIGVTNLLHSPGNPISFYSVIWYSIITFIAIPFSITLGASAGARRGSIESIVR